MKLRMSHLRRAGRRFFQSTFTVLSLATATASAAQPRLALIWPTQVEELKDVRSLVEVGLVDHVVQLERTELDVLLEEQSALLAGFTTEGLGVAVAGLQGADLVGLCLEDRTPEQGDPGSLPSGLRVLLFEVQTSFKLIDESVTVPSGENLSSDALARELVERLQMGLVKHPVSASGVVKVGIGSVRVGSWEPEALPGVDQLGGWLSRLLVRSPNVVVLERRHLGVSHWERLFRPELELPVGCDVVVEPVLSKLPDERTELQITLRPGAGKEPMTLEPWIGEMMTPQVVLVQAAAILEAVRAAPSRATTPEALADEASRLFDRAYWAAKTARAPEAYELAQAVLVLEPVHRNAQLLRARLLPEINAQRFQVWNQLSPEEREQTLTTQSWCLRDYYARRCAFVQTNRNAWSGWIQFGDPEDGYELGWLRQPATHGHLKLEQLASDLALGFVDFYQAEVERRQEQKMTFQLHSEDFGSVLREALGTMCEPKSFFEMARRLYLLEVGRYPWRNGMTLQRPGITYQVASLPDAARQFRFGQHDGYWVEMRAFRLWLQEQPEEFGPFLADWLVYDCWRDVPPRVLTLEGRRTTQAMSTSWYDTLLFARESGLTRDDCVQRLTAKVPAILSRAGGREFGNLNAILRNMHFLEQAPTVDLLKIWTLARAEQQACPAALSWRLTGVLAQREDWEAVDRVASQALALLEPGAPEARELAPTRERALAKLGRESPGAILWSSARQLFPLTTVTYPPDDWIVQGNNLFWIDAAGGLHRLDVAAGAFESFPSLGPVLTNAPLRVWDTHGRFPLTHKLAVCRDRLFACYRANGATLLVNNRSKLFWYDAREGTWHELLDQFFDWHLGQADRLLEPHPAGVLVGRHLYDAKTKQLRPVTEVGDTPGPDSAENFAMLEPHVVFWNGAIWGITGGQRLARLGGPGTFEVGARLQSVDEIIVRLLPTPVSLFVVTRHVSREATFGVWRVDP
jgi:hypothetical protein